MACALVVVALSASHESVRHEVLARYSVPFALFLVTSILATLALAWLVLGSEKRYRAVFNANLLLALVCCAVTFLAAEWAIRGLVRERVSTFPKSVVSRMTTAEYDVEIATNREGFRDIDHERATPAGSYRIAVLGDSFVVGSGVAFDEIFTSRIAALLTPSTPQGEGSLAEAGRVTVMNFGVSGTGPPHELRVWRRFASRYRPDLVLVCLYSGNDASDALKETSEERPVFVTLALVRDLIGRRRPRGARVNAPAARAPQNPELGEARGDWNAFDIENPASLEGLLRAGRAQGIPADTIRARLAAIPDSLVAEAHAFRANPFNVARAVLEPASLRDNLLLDTSEMERGWRGIEQSLRELRSEIEGAGAKMVLVCIPAGAQVDKKYWWATRLGFVLDERVLTDTPFQDRLGRFASTEGIPVVDLLPAMRRGADVALYFEQDGHWNARGHAIAAEMISEALRSSGVVGAARGADE